MKRREFITLLGGAAVAWPVVARGQQAGKLPTVGFLVAGTPETTGNRVAAFVQRMHELGWIDGRTLAIEYRWTEGYERFAEVAAEFVHLNIDIIVTNGTAAAVAAKQATSVIPIVSTVMGNPVGTGLVASLARPGGNVTGLSLQQADLAGKRLALLREVVPAYRRLAVLANTGNPVATLERGEVETAARALGFEVVRMDIQKAEDIAPRFEALKGRADALYVAGDPLVITNRLRIITLGAQLPAIFNSREYVEAGGLMSYGPNYLDLYRRAGDLVDKILRGAKPADIPVEQPVKFELVINLKTAKALGLTVPPMLLARADEVIE